MAGEGRKEGLEKRARATTLATTLVGARGCIVTQGGGEAEAHGVRHALVIFANHWLATVFKYY